MNLEQLAYLAEILGVVAVVITLVYLASKVRQGAQILWSESRQAQVACDQGGVNKFVEYPELVRLFSQSETPTTEEKNAVTLLDDRSDARQGTRMVRPAL